MPVPQRGRSAAALRSCFWWRCSSLWQKSREARDGSLCARIGVGPIGCGGMGPPASLCLLCDGPHRMASPRRAFDSMALTRGAVQCRLSQDKVGRSRCLWSATHATSATGNCWPTVLLVRRSGRCPDSRSLPGGRPCPRRRSGGGASGRGGRKLRRPGRRGFGERLQFCSPFCRGG